MAVETRNFYPELQRHATPTESGSAVVSYTSDLGGDSPILTLIHGYPQSAYMFVSRNVMRSNSVNANASGSSRTC